MQRIAPPNSPKTMLYWLAEAAKEFRERGGRLQVHVAASLNSNQSTIARFEDHRGQPRNLDETVNAYADDLHGDHWRGEDAAGVGGRLREGHAGRPLERRTPRLSPGRPVNQ